MTDQPVAINKRAAYGKQVLPGLECDRALLEMNQP